MLNIDIGDGLRVEIGQPESELIQVIEDNNLEVIVSNMDNKDSRVYILSKLYSEIVVLGNKVASVNNGSPFRNITFKVSSDDTAKTLGLNLIASARNFASEEPKAVRLYRMRTRPLIATVEVSGSFGKEYINFSENVNGDVSVKSIKGASISN